MPSARPLTIARPARTSALGERLGIGASLRGRIAAAHDRERRTREERELTERRAAGAGRPFRAGRRIARIVPGHQLVSGLAKPGERASRRSAGRPAWPAPSRRPSSDTALARQDARRARPPESRRLCSRATSCARRRSRRVQLHPGFDPRVELHGPRERRRAGAPSRRGTRFRGVEHEAIGHPSKTRKTNTSPNRSGGMATIPVRLAVRGLPEELPDAVRLLRRPRIRNRRRHVIDRRARCRSRARRDALVHGHHGAAPDLTDSLGHAMIWPLMGWTGA